KLTETVREPRTLLWARRRRRPPTSHCADYPRREHHHHHDANQDDEGGRRGILQRHEAQSDDESVLAEAQDPVREGLRAGVRDGAGPRLRGVRSSRQRSAQKRDEALNSWRGMSERCHRDQRAAYGPYHGMHPVPDRIDPRNLVGNELYEVHHDRCADDDVVVEDFELGWQRHPVKAAGEPQNRHGRVEVEPGCKRKSHRPAERREEVHSLCVSQTRRSLKTPSYTISFATLSRTAVMR